MIVINNIEEMAKYYNGKTNTYEFVGSKERQDVKFTFDLRIKSNIYAGNINAWHIKAGNIDAGNINAGDIKAEDIKAWNIKAGNINAGNIDAEDISYYAVCVSYQNIKCKSITGRRENAKHICLDGKIILKEESECWTTQEF